MMLPQQVFPLRAALLFCCHLSCTVVCSFPCQTRVAYPWHANLLMLCSSACKLFF